MYATLFINKEEGQQLPPHLPHCMVRISDRQIFPLVLCTYHVPDVVPDTADVEWDRPSL